MSISKAFLAGLTALSLAACGGKDTPVKTASDNSGDSSVSETTPELEFIAPSNEPVQVGLAGETPSNIARYIMAKGAGAARLSPDGKRVAFSYDITGKRQIWTMAANGGQAEQVTFGNGVTFFRWAPTGSALIYGADNDGNEQESYYLIDLENNSERVLMPAVDGGFRVFGGFSADGETIAYSSTERNGLDFDIYLASTQDGKSRRVFEGKYGNFVQAVSPDAGQMVISETVGEDSDNIYLLNTASGTRTELSKPAVENRANHTDGGMAWSRDGGSLYFATNKDREYTALTRYDLADNSFNVLYEEDADVSGVRLCGPDDRYVVFSTNHDGFGKLHIMARQSGVMIPAKRLPKDGRYSVDCTRGDDTLLVRVSTHDRPGDLFRVDMRTGVSKPIFKSTYAGLDKTKLVKPVSLRMPARDDVELQGLLYMPKRRGEEKPPVVFVVHGGPTAQAFPTYNANIQYLVDRGIAVFATNVRGSTGFGRTYATLDDKEKRLDSVRDLIDMLDYLEKDGRVDTENAAVMGGSYGGYVVNAVLANYPDSFKVGVCLFGVADWVTALEVASPALKASDIIEYGDINDAKWREFYTEYSPIRQADKIKVPVLYSHGAMDPRIDIAETETMVRALRANGIEAPFIRIPDEGHGWRKLSNQLFYNRRQAEFLLKHLKGE